MLYAENMFTMLTKAFLLRRGGGGGLVGAFEYVLDSKHMTHLFNLAQNWVIHS